MNAKNLPVKITSVALTAEDQENLEVVKKYLVTAENTAAVRYSLKEVAHKLLKRRP